jgi:squalene cyclase
MATKHIHARLRSCKLFQLQQAVKGSSQNEEGSWQQHEDQAFVDALELIGKAPSGDCSPVIDSVMFNAGLY